MTEKQYFFFVCVFFFVAVCVVGCIGRGCVDECQKDGTSAAVCYNLCRP